MDILILGVIILLNAIAILVSYRFIKKLPQKEKLIFMAVCLAIHYILVTLVSWLSNGINAVTTTENGQYVVYILVPINFILTIPFISSSYYKFRNKKLAKNKFINRCILMSLFGIMVLVIEFFTFQYIQNFIFQILLN